MDAESSIQVLLSTAALTTVLIAAIRVIGTLVARGLPDSPPAPLAPTAAAPDRLRLIAILTAAAMEELETDDLYLTSIVELPEPGGAKHWPRVGKMHFFQKKPYRL
jgi:hypothetical protein